MKYFIETYCYLRNGKIFCNGEELFASKSSDFLTFIKEAYYHFNTAYPRFFKMDSLSKLAFLSSELVLKDQKTTQIDLVFCNSAASLQIDRKHASTIKESNYEYANPSVFVYTLPNICLGEISIRNSFLTENVFFIQKAFDPSKIHPYTESLLSRAESDKVLCGWVEIDGDNYESLLYLVSKEGIILHTPNEIKQIYEHAARRTEV